jgi:hypothetical protein
MKNKIDDDKNAGELLAILITMRMRRCTMRGASPAGAHLGLHKKQLDAVIGQVLPSHRCGGRHA